MNRPLKRVTLETSLKPFARIDAESIDETCRTIYRQWAGLIDICEGVAIMLWVGDGSEILEWSGELDDPLPWAKSIGFCNIKRGLYPRGWGNPQPRHDYIGDPPPMTFGTLRQIIAALKRVGGEMGLNVTVGATCDPGPEFVESEWKYELHPEIFGGGPDAPMGATVGFICAYGTFHADDHRYGAFPDGIPEGTSVGTFLGRQFRDFGPAMGYDYLWLSNGMGYSHYPWNMVGENFDGLSFGATDYAAENERFVSFWRDLSAEIPDVPLEVRGTNFPLGVEIAADCVSFDGVYDIANVTNPPVNPPWGSRDLGMEVVAQLSRIAKLPEPGTYAIRHYINDPWFYTNPWWDYYNREAFDIYCPWVCSRINGAGEVEKASYLEFLTIDTERGELNPDTAMEIVPHVRRAVKMAPDAPGILTLVYPYAEFHELARDCPDEVGLTYFHDLYLRSAVQSGLPLNTVISTDDLTSVLATKPEALGETVLVAMAPQVEWALGDQLVEWVEGGGRALLFGPLTEASDELRELIGVEIGPSLPLEGEVIARFSGCGEGAEDAVLIHDPALSAGGLTEVACGGSTIGQLTNGDEARTGAHFRSMPEWNGGGVAWVRGTLPMSFSGTSANPSFSPVNGSVDTGVWMRWMLERLGYEFRQNLAMPDGRGTYTLVSRKDNGFLLTGHKPEATSSVSLRFPSGVPVITERSAFIEGSRGCYAFDRTFQHECRVFVDQRDGTCVECKEQQHPTGTERRVLVTGLEDATVTLYPSAAAVSGESVDLRGGDGMEAMYDHARACVVVTGASGGLTVTW